MKGQRKIISGGAITSRKLNRVTLETEFVYWRVYLASDNHGTLVGDPYDVLLMAMPGKNGAHEDLVAIALDQLVAVGLLERWSYGGTVWLHVVGHEKHQSAEFKRKRGRRKSALPPSQGGPTDETAAPNRTPDDVGGQGGEKAGLNASLGAPSKKTSTGKNENPSGAVPDGPALLFEVARQDRVIAVEEAFTPKRERSARRHAGGGPASVLVERLHFTEGSGASVAGPGESSAAASAEALGGVA